MAPSNRLRYIVLISIALQASALPLTKETSAADFVPDTNLAKRGCLNWLLCRGTDTGDTNTVTDDVHYDSEIGHPRPLSFDSMYTEGGHGGQVRPYSPSPGMSATLEAYPGPSQHGIEMINRKKALPQGTANRGIAGAKRQRTKPGVVSKRPVKASTKKPAAGPKLGGRVNPKLQGKHTSAKPARGQKLGGAGKPAGRAKAAPGSKARAKRAPKNITKPKSKTGVHQPKQRGVPKGARKVGASRAAPPSRRKD